MGDRLSAAETQACVPGQVLVNVGADVWRSWPNASGNTGALIGLAASGAMPGTAVQVITIGRFPYPLFSLGAGNAASIVAGFMPSRYVGGSVQVIGTCDGAGEIFLQGAVVGTSSAGNAVTLPTAISVAALRKTQPTSANAIQLLNYSVSADLGGGTFNWNATDSRSDDGGTIISTGGATGRWNRSYTGDVVSAAWFGANTNSSDNTSAIQSAFTAATALGAQVVVLPPGNYSCASALNQPNKVTFRGCGEDVTTLTFTSISDGILTSNTINGSTPGLAAVEMMTVANTKYTTLSKWSAGKTGIQVGTQLVPSGSGNGGFSTKILTCTNAGSGVTGNFEPTGQLFAQSTTATKPPAVTLNPTGALSSDHTVDVRIVTAGTLGTMQFQYSVDGTAWSATQNTSSGGSYTTGTISGTQYTITFAAGTYTGTSGSPFNYWTPSFRWSLNNVSITEPGGGPTWQISDAGAGYHDIGSSGNKLDRVRFTGWNIGILADQSEDLTVNRCLFGTGGGTSNIGIWLVNGSAAQPDNNTQPGFQFTNVIRILNCTFIGFIGILDDGGFNHLVWGCDISTEAPVVSCGATNATYSIYTEAPSLALSGGHAASFRFQPWGFFGRSANPGQGPIAVIGSTLLSGATAYVADFSAGQWNGVLGSTSCNGATFERNYVTTNQTAFCHSNAGNVGDFSWEGNYPDAGIPPIDFQPAFTVIKSGALGFPGVSGQIGAFGVGNLNGPPQASFDVAGGIRYRPYIWNNAITITNANINYDLSLEFGYTNLIIGTANPPSANFNIGGIAGALVNANANFPISGYQIIISNRTGHTMTMNHNDINETTAANRIYAAGAANVVCNVFAAQYLGTDIVTNGGWYELWHE